MSTKINKYRFVIKRERIFSANRAFVCYDDYHEFGFGTWYACAYDEHNVYCGLAFGHNPQQAKRKLLRLLNSKNPFIGQYNP